VSQPRGRGCRPRRALPGLHTADAESDLTPDDGSSYLVTQYRPLGDGDRSGKRVAVRLPRPRFPGEPERGGVQNARCETRPAPVRYLGPAAQEGSSAPPPSGRSADRPVLDGSSRPGSHRRRRAERRIFTRSVWPPMTERDLNPVWPATAIAESALPRNIKGRESTAPRSSRRVAVRAVRNPRPRPGRGRRGRARCSDGAPTPR